MTSYEIHTLVQCEVWKKFSNIHFVRIYSTSVNKNIVYLVKIHEGATLVSWTFLSSLLGAFAVAPTKSDDKYAQLTKGAFIIVNDFLRNPYFSTVRGLEKILKYSLCANLFN